MLAELMVIQLEKREFQRKSKFLFRSHIINSSYTEYEEQTVNSVITNNMIHEANLFSFKYVVYDNHGSI